MKKPVALLAATLMPRRLQVVSPPASRRMRRSPQDDVTPAVRQTNANVARR